MASRVCDVVFSHYRTVYISACLQFLRRISARKISARREFCTVHLHIWASVVPAYVSGRSYNYQESTPRRALAFGQRLWPLTQLLRKALNTLHYYSAVTKAHCKTRAFSLQRPWSCELHQCKHIHISLPYCTQSQHFLVMWPIVQPKMAVMITFVVFESTGYVPLQLSDKLVFVKITMSYLLCMHAMTD